ncbi:MAG: formate dehydrogenase subunit alpha [Chloroflexi bacterium]|nr:formate dehydrogenase subunit alpha [Chloroflexota bacterium]MCI0579246.1 formate dehydrogenase subunit alpha [Chloroflexota bacterium]MCI0647103.1 formate dehydrogenase subunit alpha [Chloroflexota bacterium]MCI0725877.1 formate dehydrogenase subunit alpha [Chloroflexota bacterium]
MIIPDKVVRTTCPYCGVGCQMNLNVRDGYIYRVDAPFNAAPNYGMLCVKGRFGTDYVKHPGRIKNPLIRANREEGRSAKPVWRETGWDEALELVAGELARIATTYGGDAIASYASAKATNEDNYIFQKLMRALIQTNNVDHCARLCHSGSVTGLQLSIGSSAMSNSIAEMENLEAFIVTGSNTTETHPVIANFLKRAVRKNGAKLIIVDPRRIEMTDFATLWLRQKPGTDVAVFQAMAHVIVKEQLYDEAFIAQRTEGFQDYLESLEEYTPEWAEEVSGVPAEHIRRAAHIYAGAGRAAIYWGMGISQSTHGTDNTLSLVNLALMCGHVGQPGTGLNPLRGQNNVQGCSDSGGLPNVFTAYQRVDNPEIRGRFERFWGAELNPQPGLTATEMVDGALSGAVRGMFVLGENPMMSEPNQNHARHALEQLEFLVCQDIFINETGELADVILPATSFAEKDGTFTNTDRRIQRCRAAVAPVGNSRPDWDILCDLGRRIEQRLGLTLSAGFAYRHPEEIWEEMRQVTPDFWGIDYARIEREGGVHWPCPSFDHPGTPFLFAEEFPRGKGKFWEVQYGTQSELPDEDYPFNLSTGRVLYHWSGSTLTGNSRLEEIYPEATCEIHPDDAVRLGLETGDWVNVSSRRGTITLRVLVTGRSPQGTIFVPFHFAEAAANLLTLDRIDGRAKIPDYKNTAVKIEKTTPPEGLDEGYHRPLLERGAIKDPVQVH